MSTIVLLNELVQQDHFTTDFTTPRAICGTSLFGVSISAPLLLTINVHAITELPADKINEILLKRIDQLNEKDHEEIMVTVKVSLICLYRGVFQC